MNIIIQSMQHNRISRSLCQMIVIQTDQIGNLVTCRLSKEKSQVTRSEFDSIHSRRHSMNIRIEVFGLFVGVCFVDVYLKTSYVYPSDLVTVRVVRLIILSHGTPYSDIQS